ELPVLLGLIESLEKTLLLLRTRDVEEELADLHAIARQVALEGADVLVPLAPDVLGDELGGKPLAREDFGVHSHDQHFLVVRTIEDADPAALREVLHAAPQEIVIEFFLRWSLERRDLASRRVDAGHHVLDGAVLARRVHGLKDQEYRPSILRI